MAESFPGRVMFLDGAVLRKNYVAIAGRPSVLSDDDEGTRTFAFSDGQWFHIDLDFDVWSVCATQKPVPSMYFVGRDGHIHVNRKGGIREREIIKDAGHEPHQYGYLFETREIGGCLYVCGGSGQIYRREESGWVHFDHGPLHRAAPLERRALFSIDGSSEDNIYTAGQNGWLWHWDARAWRNLPSPVPVDLNAVRCVAPDQVYLGGDDGVLLRSRDDQWERIEVPAGIGNIKAIEAFEDRIYIAAQAGLFVYDGRVVRRVVTGLKPAPDARRLDANDGVLWSFGTKYLCFFDGKKWTYVKHPDNPE